MKRLHRPDLFAWSSFDEARNVDFNGTCWVRPGGNVLVDPMPLSPHDRAHLEELGGAVWIVVTNSDHTRAAEDIAAWTGAAIVGPSAERADFPIACSHWLSDGDSLVPGLVAIELQGSKTPGELALSIGGHTLVTGDLIRAHAGGSLMALPDAKLEDRSLAVQSVQRLAGLEGIEAVIVGDGWPIFRGGGEALRELADSLA